MHKSDASSRDRIFPGDGFLYVEYGGMPEWDCFSSAIYVSMNERIVTRLFLSVESSEQRMMYTSIFNGINGSRRSEYQPTVLWFDGATPDD